MTHARLDGLGARLLARLAAALHAAPIPVLVVCLGLTVVCGAIASGLEVTTSRTNLGHAATGAERAFGDFLRDFGTPNDVIAVVEATGPGGQGGPGGPGRSIDEKLLRATVDDLAAALATDAAHVRSVFHRVDLDYFLRHLLLFVPLEELGQLRSLLQSDFVEKVRAGHPGGIDAMVHEITAVFSTRAAGDVDPARVTAGLDALARITAEVEERLKDPERHGWIGFRELVPPLASGAIDDAGYLQSRDGALRVVFVRPAVRSDENHVVLPLVRSIRETAAQVAARHPGVRIRVTGLPALQADETGIVESDMRRTTAVSLLAVALVLLYGYRRPRQALLSLFSLGAGILWTLAWVRLQFGQVNIVASIFAPILLGRGSDFDVYLINRYNAARAAGLDPRAALIRSLAASGGMVTGALITSLAFFVAVLGQFGVFYQLGVVVGTGLLIVLVASLVITPALLVLVGEGHSAFEDRVERVLARIPAFGAGPGAFALRRPGTVLAVSVVAIALLAAYARHPQFDYDLLKLFPPATESVEAQLDLGRRSDYGSDVVVVATPGVEEARALAARLAQRPHVGRVESIASFLPPGQAEKLPAIAAMRSLAESIPPLTRAERPTPAHAFAEAFDQLADVVDDKVFLAAQSDNPMVPALRRLVRAVESLAAASRAWPPQEAQRRVDGVEAQLFALLGTAREVLRANYEDLKPLVLADLPAATRERFLGTDGRTAVYVFPRTPGAGPELDGFVRDVRAVAPEATGFPVIYFDSSRSILAGLVRSSLYALAIVVVAVLLHFRALRAAALTLVPLAVAAIATPAFMKALGIPHNVANIVALPLLIGMSADYGLQLVHHVRTFPDDSLRSALADTGLGVFLAGSTTAAGFGALTLASHLGGRALGMELFLGTLAALIGALVILPAVLALGRPAAAR